MERSQMLSSRSSTNGIQPAWPSLNAIRSLGKRDSFPDISQSAKAASAFCAVSAIVTAIGASGDVMGSLELDPMCMLMTVSVSLHTAKNGSQWSEWTLGSFRRGGSSEKATAFDPLSAHRRGCSAVHLRST